MGKMIFWTSLDTETTHALLRSARALSSLESGEWRQSSARRRKCATVASRARAVSVVSVLTGCTQLLTDDRYDGAPPSKHTPGSQLVPGTGYRRTTSRYHSRAFHYGAQQDRFVHPTSNYHSFARRFLAIKTTCWERSFLYLEDFICRRASSSLLHL